MKADVEMGGKLHPLFLRQFRLFEFVRDEDLSLLGDISEVIERDRDKPVFRAYDENSGVYLVHNGMVKYGLGTLDGREMVL